MLRLYHSRDPLRLMHDRYSEDDRSRHDNQRHSSGRLDSDPREESDGDLLTLSRAVVLSVHPPDPTTVFGIQTDSLEDYVYYRFGFRLNENPYTGVLSSASSATFRDWLEVRRALGCQQLDVSASCQKPLQDFLECLLSADPLRVVPAKFWDLMVHI